MTSSSSRRARVAEEKARRKLEREPVVLEFPWDANVLQFHGPIIETSLTIAPAHETALRQAGQAIPAPVRCRFSSTPAPTAVSFGMTSLTAPDLS